MSLAADLELDVVALLVLLDPRGYLSKFVRPKFVKGASASIASLSMFLIGLGRNEGNDRVFWSGHVAHTRSVLATADLDELEARMLAAYFTNELSFFFIPK